MQKDLINILKHRLPGPLPGPEAQYRMAHVARRQAVAPPPNVKMAGVLALFYPREEEWHLVLIERAGQHPGDRHRGQISFPGGRYEPGDRQLVNTALREAEEEVGVEAERVRVLGPLTELYIPVSNFLVHPFVGYLTHTPHFQRQASEVESILEVPFTHLRNPETIQAIDLKVSGNITLKNVPYFNIDGKIVWGATAMMLSELLEVIR